MLVAVFMFFGSGCRYAREYDTPHLFTEMLHQSFGSHLCYCFIMVAILEVPNYLSGYLFFKSYILYADWIVFEEEYFQLIQLPCDVFVFHSFPFLQMAFAKSGNLFFRLTKEEGRNKASSDLWTGRLQPVHKSE